MLFSVADAEGLAGVNRFVPEAFERKVPTVARFDLAAAFELAAECRAHMIGVRLPSGAPGEGAKARFAAVLKGLKATGQSLLLELPQAPWPDLLAALTPALDAVEAEGLAELVPEPVPPTSGGRLAYLDPVRGIGKMFTGGKLLDRMRDWFKEIF